MSEAGMSKADYWKDPAVLAKHARTRREKYADDPELRAAEAKRVRDAYARRTGMVRINKARVALEKLHTDVSPAALSELMDRPTYYLSRLISDNRFPPPAERGVYSLEKARALLTVLADHEDAYASLRGDHTHTIVKLFKIGG